MNKKLYRKQAINGFIYLTPWLIGFIVFQLYPLLSSLYYSFTDYNMGTKNSFVGLTNYVKLFKRDRDFYRSLFITLKYVFMTLPMKLTFALFVAMLLNMKIKAMNVYRTVYYLPSILGGSVTVSILWKFLFQREGIINTALSRIGISGIDWLGSPKYALFTFSLLSVWQFGSSMVLFLAGLKQVPSDLYEVAMVDGASAVRRFFSITLPMLSPIIFFNLIVQMINTFQEFTGVFVVTKGGPAKSTYLYALMLYQQAFMHNNMGYSCALSWIFFVIIMAFTIVLFRWSSVWVFYEDGGGK